MGTIKATGIILVSLCLLSISCSRAEKSSPTAVPASASVSTTMPERDVHSYSNPEKIRVTHVDLDVEVLFDRKVLQGTATHKLERAADSGSSPLVLDTRGLSISKAESSGDGVSFQPAEFSLGKADPILGAALEIKLPATANTVRVTYETSPEAAGLQWLDPPQTAGKKHPYLFTQSEPILVRSWVPLQDSPAVRITYSAHVRTPANLRAVMSAENNPKQPANGDYRMKMTNAIPSYLIALAVGDIAFRATGARTGVYAEPKVVDAAAREFSDTEKMVEATEKLYGPYRWERYDILVLPPSFPIGGMENPRLTFATPTVIAGDKSLVSLVAHELAHSWSGNLVTNATWRDFWLNEGMTTYLERRIIEEVYGKQRAEMEAVLGRQDLERELTSLPDRDEILHIDLAGRNPDDGFTQLPYEKGALFLRHLEETWGRARFDAFLKGYFDHFAFRSITTADFVAYLKQNLLNLDLALESKVPLDQWLYQPGLPANAPKPTSDAFAKVEGQVKEWVDGKQKAAALKTAGWTTQEWLHFLRYLPQELSAERMTELDRAFGLTKSGNSEIAHQWLLMSIRNRYEPAMPRLEQYLTSIGRRKLIKPLYEELVKTPEGRTRAESIYQKARPGYHPIAAATIDQVMKGTEK